MLTEKIIDEEMQWINKCETNKTKIPYTAFRASLNRIKEHLVKQNKDPNASCYDIKCPGHLADDTCKNGSRLCFIRKLTPSPIYENKKRE